MAGSEPRPLVAGNWKMNGLKAAAAELGRIIQGYAELRPQADLRSRLHCVAQDVAGRNLRNVSQRRKAFCLRALPRAGRTEHDQIQRHVRAVIYPRRPRIRVFFMKPS